MQYYKNHEVQIGLWGVNFFDKLVEEPIEYQQMKTMEKNLALDKKTIMKKQHMGLRTSF